MAMLHSIAHAVRRIPEWVEATIVLGATFGVMIVSYALAGTSPDTGTTAVELTDENLTGLMEWEVLLLISLGIFLFVRGWRRADLHLNINGPLTMMGLKLWLLSIVLYYGIGIPLMLIPAFGASAQVVSFQIEVSLPVILALSALNPIYEELFTVVYVFRKLTWARPSVAIITSAALRASVHAYQGLFQMASVFVLGLALGIYFQKHRQLWPLLIAHAIMDLLGLLMADS